MDGSEIHAVSVAVLKEGRFLLVRRGHAPSRGLFAFPGGRLEAGEAAPDAARRELHEETGLRAGELSLIEEMVIEGDDGTRRYRLKIFRALEVEGIAEAGDDAEYVGWYTMDEMRALPITASTLAVAENILAHSPSP